MILNTVTAQFIWYSVKSIQLKLKIKMKIISHVLLAILLSIVKDVTCVEYLPSEPATWMDVRGREKFFDYAEVAEANRYYYASTKEDQSSYSNNVDSELFYVSSFALI